MSSGDLELRGGGAPYLNKLAILLDLDDKAVFIVCEISPGKGEAVGRGGLEIEEQGSTQEELALLAVDAVDVVLDVGIAIVGNHHGIVGALVGPISLFPPVGHAVIISICRLGACKPGPLGGHADRQFVLVGDEFAFLAKALHFVNHIAVGQVAIRQRGADFWQEFVNEVASCPFLKNRIGIGCRLTVATTIASELGRIKHTVAIGVLPVV